MREDRYDEEQRQIVEIIFEKNWMKNYKWTVLEKV